MCKNPDSKLTEFYLLTDNNSTFLFSTDFWTGISEAAYGRLILHGFVSPDRPEPMGIHVYSGKDGRKLWANTEAIYQYSLNSHEGVVATKNLDQIQYSIIDLDSGQFIRTINQGEFQMPGVSEKGNFHSISVYREGEENFQLIGDFISNRLQKTIAGLVEYTETDRLIVISYYIRASNKYINECSIFDLDGLCLATEVLATSDQLALNTFLVQNQTVALIKERKEVIFYEI